LAEFGVVSPIGREGLDRLLTIAADADDGRESAEARASLEMLAALLGVNDRRIIAGGRTMEVGRRLPEGAASARRQLAHRCDHD
jgi:transposase